MAGKLCAVTFALALLMVSAMQAPSVEKQLARRIVELNAYGEIKPGNDSPPGFTDKKAEAASGKVKAKDDGEVGSKITEEFEVGSKMLLEQVPKEPCKPPKVLTDKGCRYPPLRTTHVVQVPAAGEQDDDEGPAPVLYGECRGSYTEMTKDSTTVYGPSAISTEIIKDSTTCASSSHCAVSLEHIALRLRIAPKRLSCKCAPQFVPSCKDAKVDIPTTLLGRKRKCCECCYVAIQKGKRRRAKRSRTTGN